MADPFAELAKLIAGLDEIAANGVDSVSADVSAAVAGIVENEYESGQGPGGQGWAAKRDGSPSHLQKSGAMRAGTQAVAGVKGVSVRIPKPGGFHQGGTSRMVARPLVPDGDTLPPDWERPIREAATASLTKALTK